MSLSCGSKGRKVSVFVLWIPIVILGPTFSAKAGSAGISSVVSSRIRNSLVKIFCLVNAIISYYSPCILFGGAFWQIICVQRDTISTVKRVGQPGSNFSLAGVISADDAQRITVEKCAEIIQVPASEPNICFGIVKLIKTIIIKPEFMRNPL